MKVGVFTSRPGWPRLEALADYVSKKHNKTLDLDYVAFDAGAFKKKISHYTQNYEQFLVGSEWGQDFLKQFPLAPSSLLHIGAADAWVKEGDGWWPRSFLHRGLSRVLAKKGSTVDVGSDLLIVGTGAIASAYISAFIKMGFKRVNISSPQEGRAKAFVQVVSRRFLGVEFNEVSPEKIVTLPGIHSALVNTLISSEHPRTVEELSYFNFLQKGGLVAESAFLPLKPHLLQEADSVGATTIAGHEVYAVSDSLWASQVLSIDMDASDYLKYLLNRYTQ